MLIYFGFCFNNLELGENMGPKKKIKAKDLKISVINEKEFFDLL